MKCIGKITSVPEYSTILIDAGLAVKVSIDVHFHELIPSSSERSILYASNYHPDWLGILAQRRDLRLATQDLPTVHAFHAAIRNLR